jgi:hypothetical protein
MSIKVEANAAHIVEEPKKDLSRICCAEDHPAATSRSTTPKGSRIRSGSEPVAFQQFSAKQLAEQVYLYQRHLQQRVNQYQARVSILHAAEAKRTTLLHQLETLMERHLALKEAYTRQCVEHVALQCQGTITHFQVDTLREKKAELLQFQTSCQNLQRQVLEATTDANEVGKNTQRLKEQLQTEFLHLQNMRNHARSAANKERQHLVNLLRDNLCLRDSLTESRQCVLALHAQLAAPLPTQLAAPLPTTNRSEIKLVSSTTKPRQPFTHFEEQMPMLEDTTLVEATKTDKPITETKRGYLKRPSRNPAHDIQPVCKKVMRAQPSVEMFPLMPVRSPSGGYAISCA